MWGKRFHVRVCLYRGTSPSDLFSVFPTRRVTAVRREVCAGGQLGRCDQANPGRLAAIPTNCLDADGPGVALGLRCVSPKYA
jgi:hypothetical protein